MPTVVTKTIKPAGGGDYTTLEAWAAARLGVALVDTIERAECYAGNCGGMWMPSGTSTDATSRVEIVAAASARHAGVWDATKAHISNAGNWCVINTTGARCVVDGLQLGSPVGGVQDLGAVNTYVVGCLAVAANGYQNCRAASCIAVATTQGSGTGYEYLITATYTANCCTAVGYRRGYRCGYGTAIVKNCLAQSCNDGFSGTFSAASDYNISDIADDAPGTHSKTGVVQFVDAAAKDYHLAASDTVARGAGINLTASGITTDIDGDARPATGAWDIGADQVVESPTPTPCGGRMPWGRDPWGRPAWGSAMCGWRHP